MKTDFYNQPEKIMHLKKKGLTYKECLDVLAKEVEFEFKERELELKEQFNESFDIAFVVDRNHPSALEKIAMELESYNSIYTDVNEKYL
jgi:hypothetical protein